jgi:fatty-acyl-CoA synthase
LTASDRLYNCLPMHHSVGGVVAVGAPLVSGGSVVIAERFSARGFWDDIAQWECTAFQYIGELCRYLLAAPIDPAERLHRVRIAIGNGLSQEAWQPFIDRFGPLRILEFYASTEGNVWLYNLEGKIGSIGRVPPYVAVREQIALARFEYGSQMPARGSDGFCIRCADGEVGEALGRIGKEPGGRFEGYSEEVETERKVLRDVFKPGDAWMRTGDLMRRDAYGFYTFVDRIGDTFRWKGENVSTSEVETALRACPGVEEAVVYGVVVPGADGRAGMALLQIDQRFDLDALPGRLEILPRYARPLFLRIAAKIEITETFKAKRRAYVNEGFDPERIADPLYVFDRQPQTFVVLDAERYVAIRNRTISF